MTGSSRSLASGQHGNVAAVASCRRFASDFFNLLLVRFHQAEIIIVKHLIQRRYEETTWELNDQGCDLGRRKNDASNHLYEAGFADVAIQVDINKIKVYVR